MRTTFVRGSVGQVVAGLIWLTSAALGIWASQRLAILILVLGGMFIFPLTQLGLRLLGRPAGLPGGHPINPLAMQIAFMVPLNMLLVGAASLYNINLVLSRLHANRRHTLSTIHLFVWNVWEFCFSGCHINPGKRGHCPTLPCFLPLAGGLQPLFC